MKEEPTVKSEILPKGDLSWIIIFGVILASIVALCLINPTGISVNATNVSEAKNPSLNFDVSGDEGYNVTIERQPNAIVFTHEFQPGEDTIYIQEYRGVLKSDPFWYKGSFRYKVTKDNMQNFPDSFGFTLITATSTYSRTITSAEIARL